MATWSFNSRKPWQPSSSAAAAVARRNREMRKKKEAFMETDGYNEFCGNGELEVGFELLMAAPWHEI